MMDQRTMETILLIGADGAIGKRYSAILKFLGRKVIPFDVLSSDKDLDLNYDGVIIASPTETHYQYLKRLENKWVPILCEKPMCASLEEADLINQSENLKLHVSIVDNWAHMIGNSSTHNTILYNNFYTGKERLSWNLAQPIYLTSSGMLTTDLKAPFFCAHHVDSKESYRSTDVDESYVSMLNMWLTTRNTNWNALDGLCMQDAIQKWENKQCV